LADFFSPLAINPVAASPHLFATTDAAVIANEGATATTER
jgi:hypothetical protein